MGIMEPRRLGRLAGVAVPAAAGLEQDARWLKSKGGGDTDVTGTGVPKMRLQSRGLVGPARDMQTVKVW